MPVDARYCAFHAHAIFQPVELNDSGKNMKKISKQIARSKAVSNVLASLRIEQLVPGEYVIKGMTACVDGKDTTSNVLQEVMRRHVTLRRN